MSWQTQLFPDDELTSPMTHIEKNLGDEGGLSDSIAQILEDMDTEPSSNARHRTRTRKTSSMATGAPTVTIPKRDTGVQTVNDLITDESPEFAARPPPCKKREMIPSMAVFQEVDKIALQVFSSISLGLPKNIHLCRMWFQNLRFPLWINLPL